MRDRGGSPRARVRCCGLRGSEANGYGAVASACVARLATEPCVAALRASYVLWPAWPLEPGLTGYGGACGACLLFACARVRALCSVLLCCVVRVLCLCVCARACVVVCMHGVYLCIHSDGQTQMYIYIHSDGHRSRQVCLGTFSDGRDRMYSDGYVYIATYMHTYPPYIPTYIRTYLLTYQPTYIPIYLHTYYITTFLPFFAGGYLDISTIFAVEGDAASRNRVALPSHAGRASGMARPRLGRWF